MQYEYFDLGSAPSDEDCASVGDDNYAVRAKRECQAFLRQFVRALGEPPPNACFRVLVNPHDFGSYYSLAIHFDPKDPAAVAYAVRCDEEAPDQWDLAARLELGAARRRERETLRYPDTPGAPD